MSEGGLTRPLKLTPPALRLSVSGNPGAFHSPNVRTHHVQTRVGTDHLRGTPKQQQNDNLRGSAMTVFAFVCLGFLIGT